MKAKIIFTECISTAALADALKAGDANRYGTKSSLDKPQQSHTQQQSQFKAEHRLRWWQEWQYKQGKERQHQLKFEVVASNVEKMGRQWKDCS